MSRNRRRKPPPPKNAPSALTTSFAEAVEPSVAIAVMLAQKAVLVVSGEEEAPAVIAAACDGIINCCQTLDERGPEAAVAVLTEITGLLHDALAEIIGRDGHPDHWHCALIGWLAVERISILLETR